MKCESRSALGCIEEIVIREAEVPRCKPFYERHALLRHFSFPNTISSVFKQRNCSLTVDLTGGAG